MQTEEISKAVRDAGLIGQLLRVWEDSVRATHHFLTERDIQSIRPQVEEALRHIETLIVVCEKGAPVGFMGIQERKIEALFLDPAHIGKGLGRRLIRLATDKYDAIYIDVNEQNGKAAAVYRHLGFDVFRCDETDEQGNPFPILRMRLSAAPRHP